jgi:hypothetical protein
MMYSLLVTSTLLHLAVCQDVLFWAPWTTSDNPSTAASLNLDLASAASAAHVRHEVGQLEAGLPHISFSYGPALEPGNGHSAHRIVVILQETKGKVSAVAVAKELEKRVAAIKGVEKVKILDQTTILFPKSDSIKFRVVKGCLLAPYAVLALFIIKRWLRGPKKSKQQ